METIVDIIIKIVAALLALGAGYLGKWLIAWLKSKMDEKAAAKLDLFVTELVEAAEQMYKENDPDGSIRLGYVKGMLVQYGYEMTDAVKALIESKVFSINLLNKTTGELLIGEEIKAVTGFTDGEGGGSK